MYSLLQVVAVVIAALPMALSVAHALELPGKMRLDERTYRAVQHIYYPGFTIGGAAEPLSVVVTGLLLFLVPAGTTAFWAVLLAFFCLAGNGRDLLARDPPGKQILDGRRAGGRAWRSLLRGWREARRSAAGLDRTS
ncbi:hypothetical protein [Mesorhizobium opportunistum]|uniref:DUF1772 domain-containing protein n=1 Tax=Mesorhizobium opportunistum (strain LMG 24607 / HAMBI 3007 / WSM2075) TaxID=536019 RepID=F7Y983_MESOW|nr:hypothetical protein [Mesorhizobium opportunistum]AEH86455.1 conserved hypothetical protein [Mesorhizobium opportunistum WSM2075]